MDTAESVEVEKSPLREAYVLLNATHPAELSTRYTQEDQRLMKLQKWDYKDHDLIINKIRHILENADMGKSRIQRKSGGQISYGFGIIMRLVVRSGGTKTS
jgi:hypothetical protein